MNYNTVTGKDEININILKIMVLEECIVEIKRLNLAFQRPDAVWVDLPYEKLLNFPYTLMGKAYYCLIVDI
jgi:hypothetical protein